MATGALRCIRIEKELPEREMRHHPLPWKGFLRFTRAGLQTIILLIALGILMPCLVFGEETGGIQVVTIKTLLRTYDPVVISGTMIPVLDGTALTSLRVFSAQQDMGDTRCVVTQQSKSSI